MNIKAFDILPTIVAKFTTKKENKPVAQTLEHLNDKITFVFVDDLYPERCLEIIKMYESKGIKNIKLFTSKSVSSPYRVHIDSIISKTQYSEFILKQLSKYITTDYVLISQWDGYIINFHKWNDEFFNYDYLGSPWWWKNNITYGGNGGFSLRSKKLLNLTTTLDYNGDVPEDEFICVTQLNTLLNNGMKFATKEFSKTFAVENEVGEESFGFHSYSTQNIGIAKSLYTQKFHHSGDLGDIIYSLPFIKALGGGVLILSSDYHDMEIRSPMTLPKAEMINSLLMGQEYIFDVRCTPSKPSDIDVDLNQFRKIFIDWGNQKFTEDEVVIIRKKTLTQLYREMLNPNVSPDFDKNKWLHYKEKIVIDDKPIIINKTERYPREGFPWSKLVNEYGKKMLFVGSQHEYNLFIKKYGYVDFYPTKSYLTLAHVINGAKLFIGNQSFPYSLAEGMKINTLQETNNTIAPNCMYIRENSYLTYDDSSLEYVKIKQFVDSHI